MSKYLMLITIGPVQDLISTARRSRDLWFGSWFLSEISKTAARTIVEYNSGRMETMIFPAATEADLKDNSSFNSANKILAIVDGSPADVGRKLRSGIDARLTEMYAAAFNGKEDDFDFDLAKRQLADLIELYWTAVEFDGSDEQYSASRAKVEYLAASRKNTRDFRAVDWGANTPKSSLDGNRESVVCEALRKMTPAQLYKRFKIREREQLCGVGLFKRLGLAKDEAGNGLDRFASTSHIAARPFLNNLTDGQEFTDFKRGMLALGLDEDEFHSIPDEQRHPVFGLADGHLLYEERMRDYFDDASKIEKAKAILKSFLETAFGKDKRPSPYYALLLADGDDMGKAIDAQTTQKGHRALSRALSEFSAKVKDIVNGKYKGSLFYAGGDDVLALVPLNVVMDCADELNRTFRESLAEFRYDGERSPTLSVGIAVTHHLQPLSDALELARNAERRAKGVEGKNALAVIVDKRSGTSRMIAGKFGEISSRLRELIALAENGVVSNQLGYELRDLSRRLEIAGDPLTDQKNVLGDIKKAETKRIIDRKLSKMDTVKIRDVDREGTFGEIYRLAKQNDGTERLADELIIAKFLAAVGQQTQPQDVGQEGSYE